MVPAGVAVVVFALNNKSIVALNLWPFDMIVEMPLYLAVTFVLTAGVFLGGVVSWAGAGRLRGAVREHAYAREVARRELAAEREKTEALERDLRARDLERKKAQASTGPKLGPQLRAEPGQQTLPPLSSSPS